MAWEKRKTGTYYYEKKRMGGKTVSIYWGNGELAREREQQIRLRRVTKRARRLTKKEDKELFNEVRARSKQALHLLLVSVAQLYRLKGRRVPKLCSKAERTPGAQPPGAQPSGCIPDPRLQPGILSLSCDSRRQDAQSRHQIDTTHKFAAQPVARAATPRKTAPGLAKCAT